MFVFPPPLRGRGRVGGATRGPPMWTPTPDLKSELRSPRPPQGGGEAYIMSYITGAG